jgi:hypothetical protein
MTIKNKLKQIKNLIKEIEGEIGIKNESCEKETEQEVKPAEENQNFSLFKTFEITIPNDYNHATQLKEFKRENEKYFYYFNSEITDKNLKPSNKLIPDKKYQVKIWNILKKVSSDECLDFLKEQKVILTGAQGLSLVFQEAKDKLPIGKWSYSYDEKDKLWKDVYGYLRVPNILRFSDGVFYFHLYYFEYDRNVNDCLMGFVD